MAHDVFISYSQYDKTIANELYAEISSQGFCCWMAPQDVVKGHKYKPQIVNAIKECKDFLLILSSRSQNSDNVESEVDIAYDEGKRILPFMVEKVELNDSMKYSIKGIDWICAYDDLAAAKEILFRDLSANNDSVKLAGKPSSTSSTCEPSNMSKSTSVTPVDSDANISGTKKRKSLTSVLFFILLISIISVVVYKYHDLLEEYITQEFNLSTTATVASDESAKPQLPVIDDDSPEIQVLPDPDILTKELMQVDQSDFSEKEKTTISNIMIDASSKVESVLREYTPVVQNTLDLSSQINKHKVSLTSILNELNVFNDKLSALNNRLNIDAVKRYKELIRVYRTYQNAVIADGQQDNFIDITFSINTAIHNMQKTLSGFDTFINNVGIEMVRIKGGEFTQGSYESDDEHPVHKVIINKDFLIGIYEVTEQQWEKVNGVSSDSTFPVVNVSWDEAVEFCSKLSSLDGALTYRLPTEAEWEYACRAGSTTMYNNYHNSKADLESCCWYRSVNAVKAFQVGRLDSNSWGLFDMHGNVSEWCSDWYGEYSSSPAVDPKGPESGTEKVYRGGNWSSLAEACRSSARAKLRKDSKDDKIGIRIVLDVSEILVDDEGIIDEL